MTHFDTELCLGGCGKRVFNRFQRCLKCRARKCKACGETFTMKMVDSETCGACQEKRANKARIWGEG